ncbi:MAG: cyclic nucleotide-binding domain-containing protein, partial [bacterium]|nr:cyclic nucleotide-binding domain-containing protein [bacterium]
INIGSILGVGKPQTSDGGNGFVIYREDANKKLYQTFEVQKRKDNKLGNLYTIVIEEGKVGSKEGKRAVEYENIDRLKISFPNFIKGEERAVTFTIVRGPSNKQELMFHKDNLRTIPKVTNQPKSLTLPKRNVLFNKGDPGNEMYIIKSGKIGLFTEVNKEKVPLAFLDQNSFFGEMALFEKAERSVGAMAIEDSELMVISREVFDANLKKIPGWFVTMFKTLIERLRIADKKIENMEKHIAELEKPSKKG